ncbi:hypothetical protein [Nonomuraea angiospora]|uniref:hypothetical protein n=1 Tax=Nonomuraea angiospora TaxID=46172 RepID=UPI003F5474B2
MSSTVLVARPDSAGDVLLAGPAVCAVGAHADRVVLLAGPRGRAAAELLPGVDRVIEWRAPWIDADPPPVTGEHVARLMDALPDAGEAVVLLTVASAAGFEPADGGALVAGNTGPAHLAGVTAAQVVKAVRELIP